MLHKYIDNLGDDIADNISHLSKVTLCIIDAVCKFTEKPHAVRSKLRKHGEKNSAESVFRCSSTNGEVLELVIKCAVCVQSFIAQNISGFFGFLTEFCHSFRTRFDKRVKLLCGFTEYCHCNSITLGFIFHFSEGIDDFPINGVAVTHITLCIINGNAELLVSLGHFVHLGGNGL